jgi:hypothetical protein
MLHSTLRSRSTWRSVPLADDDHLRSKPPHALPTILLAPVALDAQEAGAQAEGDS